MFHHPATAQNSVEGSSAAVLRMPGVCRVGCHPKNQVPVPPHSPPASCSLLHVPAQPQSLSAQTPSHELGSVNHFPGSALGSIFPDLPEAMLYLHHLPLRKFFKVPFEIIWSGGKPSLAFLFFLSFPLFVPNPSAPSSPGSALAL